MNFKKLSKMVLVMAVISGFCVNVLPLQAKAYLGPVTQRNLFIVNMPGQTLIEAANGDMVEMTVVVPIIPGASTQVQPSYDRNMVELVASVPVNGGINGAGVTFFFRMINDGETKIVIKALTGKGKVNRMYEQNVRIVSPYLPA